jgi:CelD/BcsL family acetyltransferase involved in cellulose biosynthesis
MRVEVISARELTPDQVAAWSRLQQADPRLDSPFLRPEFTQAVAAVREDVEVGILQENGQWLGFFPFQRNKDNIGVPVGSPANDIQAVVVSGDVAWNAEHLVRACELQAWKFDHLLASQDNFRPYHVVVADSHFTDLSDGFDAWRAERHKKGGAAEVRNVFKMARKIQRDIGPLRFELASDDPSVLEALIVWKREQIRRTKVADIFTLDWVEPLLIRVLSTRTEHFSGRVSALYVGDRLIAADMGIRSGDVLAGWFKSYDFELRKYSPGSQLFLQIAQACPESGIRRIDHGKGDAYWKLSFRSGAFPVAEGTVDFRPVARLLNQSWLRARDWVRRSPLRRPAHRVNRMLSKARALLGRPS